MSRNAARGVTKRGTGRRSHCPFPGDRSLVICYLQQDRFDSQVFDIRRPYEIEDSRPFDCVKIPYTSSSFALQSLELRS